jgi:hypothetical protein
MVAFRGLPWLVELQHHD